MMKLRLDDLQVESFATEAQQVRGGTVHGAEDTYAATCYPCPPNQSADGGDTCAPLASCAGFYNTCDGANTCQGCATVPWSNVTCGGIATCEPFGVQTCGQMCPVNTA